MPRRRDSLLHQFFFHHQSVYFPIKQTALGISFEPSPITRKLSRLQIIYACVRLTNYVTPRFVRNEFKRVENIRTNISLILFIRKVFFFLSFFLRNHAKERNRISFKKDRCKIFVSMGHLLIKIIAFTSYTRKVYASRTGFFSQSITGKIRVPIYTIIFDRGSLIGLSPARGITLNSNKGDKREQR